MDTLSSLTTYGPITRRTTGPESTKEESGVWNKERELSYCCLN